MNTIVRWTFLVVVVAAIVIAIMISMLPQRISVEAAAMTVAPLMTTVDEEGKTRIRERYVVSSPLGGRLRRITLDPGDAVRAEETVIAVIEPTDPHLLDARARAEAEARVRAAEAALRQAGANLERAKASYDFAEDDLARMERAYANSAAPARELSEARLALQTSSEDYHAAQFAEEIAKFELELARSALVYTGDVEEGNGQLSIRSPITGDVLRVFQESVAVVTPGTALLELGDRRDLEIVIDVLSSDAVRIVPGQRILIDHWGGDGTLEALVRLVEPSAFTKISSLGIEEQRVNVIADFKTPPEARETLGDGFRVDASIVVWEAVEVGQIPLSAAFRAGGEWAVFAIADGRAVLRTVEIGHRSDRAVQITAGLAPGDLVITHPGDTIADGVRVEVTEP